GRRYRRRKRPRRAPQCWGCGASRCAERGARLQPRSLLLLRSCHCSNRSNVLDVAQRVADAWPRRGFGCLNRAADQGFLILPSGCDCLFRNAKGGEPSLAPRDRILSPLRLDLGGVAVGCLIGTGMAAKPMGSAVEKARSAAGSNFEGELPGRVLDRFDII